MTLRELTIEEFKEHSGNYDSQSFLQTPEMAKLLEKRGYDVRYLGYQVENKLEIISLSYIMLVTGGFQMKIDSGPVHSNSKYLKQFYKALQGYAKSNGVLELIVEPYDDYQLFTSSGVPSNQGNDNLIEDFTSSGYHHDGLTTGFTGKYLSWHYVKNLEGVTSETLLSSFSKTGRALVKKAMSFGIKVRVLKRDELHLFKEITTSTSNRHDYMDKSLDYYQDFYDSFEGKAEFVIATLNFREYDHNLQIKAEALENKLKLLDERFRENADSPKYHRQRSEIINQLASFETRRQEVQSFIQKYDNQDVVLAGSLFVYSLKETVYFFSGSYTEFNKFYAPAVLQEYVMQEALKRGSTFYNLLGIQGTFNYYPSPFKYKGIQLLKKVLKRN
ncbi:aminoacyltransferase [Streptococcus agalactiae]|uniref:aminoacyltransferase n=1 Tax=Streptococcus agalactiae TaxID=1311 RepID=UPI001374E2CE|nr:aminoacyltransferase [Streptococcus agalactiae]KAF1258465.1 peptidoglycan branched peptide synthesis protein [Streptococcus agalactiae]